MAQKKKRSQEPPDKFLIKLNLSFQGLMSLVALGYFLYYLVEYREMKHAFLWVIGVNFLLAFYFLVTLYFYQDLKNSAHIPYLHTFLEITTVTIVILLIKEAYNAQTILTGPLVMIYLLLIFLNTLRANPYLTLGCAILAVAQHSVLFWVFMEEIPDDLKIELIDLGLSGYLQKSLYILIAGGIGYHVSKRIRASHQI